MRLRMLERRPNFATQEAALTDHTAYKDRIWDRQPVGEQLLHELIEGARRASSELDCYGRRLIDSTGVRLRDIVDHLVFGDSSLVDRIELAGWVAGSDGVWRNAEGLFPALIAGERTEVWLRVESADSFKAATNACPSIEGDSHAPLRKLLVSGNNQVAFGAIERNGSPAFTVAPSDRHIVREARLILQRFRSRRREFDSVEAGLSHTDELVDSAVDAIGPHWACDLWLKAERDYWMRRCAPGRLQKARQDEVGIGWANIDHHTYDGSRKHFRYTIRILEKLGYELREMLYAGELAGWGSQVLWQPVIGSTIFADVDLSAEELSVDFAHEELPELECHRRAGLVSALLGESILEAGLNHVAGLYDQRRLRDQFARANIQMMQPFSDMPHLYQELTTGDWMAVDPDKVSALEAAGHIDPAEAEAIRLNGTVATHLENIERNEGYKGFNREGIDSVLRKLDPRANAGAQR